MQFVDKVKEVVPHEKNHANDLEVFFEQNELLADPVTRRDYFEHLDDQDFLQLLQQTANVIRTGDSNQSQSFDGEKVRLMMHDVPDQREKESLLVDTWHTAKSILKDRKLSDQDALDYAGLTVAGGILLTHPFIDGNGRTSRTLSYIMMRGTEHENELHDILASSGGGGNWQVALSSELRARFKRPFHGEQPDKIEWEFFFAGEGEDAYGGDITDSLYKENIIRHFIEEADDETKQLVHQAERSDDENGSVTLNGHKLLEILAADEGAAGYAQQLYGLMREERAMTIKGFLVGMERGDLIFDQSSYLKSYSEWQGTEVREKRAARARHEIAKRSLKDGKMALRDQAVTQHRTISDVYEDVRK